MPRGYLQNASSQLQTRKNTWGQLNTAIWLVYWTDTDTRGFWLAKRTLGCKNFMSENLLEINRYFTLTSYCNTIGQSNNTFSVSGFLWQKTKSPSFDLFILWPTKQITNTYRNHFSRSSENRSKTFTSVIYKCIHCFRVVIATLVNYTLVKVLLNWPMFSLGREKLIRPVNLLWLYL